MLAIPALTEREKLTYVYDFPQIAHFPVSNCTLKRIMLQI